MNLLKLVPAAIALLSLAACSGEAKPEEAAPAPKTPAVAPKAPDTPAPAAASAEVPADLPQGLLVTYSQFPVKDGQVQPIPGAARLELIRREGGEWKTEVIEDKDSNVFHKAFVYGAGFVTIGGMDAVVKFWTRGADGALSSKVIWQEAFGGKFNRMRDAEVGAVYAGELDIPVGTHDQGVFAVLRPAGDSFKIEKLDKQANTFIHEVELGDLDKDGALEVYTTPSEPNTLEGGAQHGEVVRYVPSKGEGRVVVADLGNRHAKEIYVGDVDGDGTDELYVAVEALTKGEGGSEIVEPVEIRRYDSGTDAKAGFVIAKIQDRFCRFLTVGDVDGDGKREMVAAAFKSGLWLLRPGKDPRGEWSSESIDRESGGFEHASVLADLDGDKRDELYVASDDHGELRRYAWVNGRAKRSLVTKRDVPRSMMTWNLMPAPAALLAPVPKAP